MELGFRVRVGATNVRAPVCVQTVARCCGAAGRVFVAAVLLWVTRCCGAGGVTCDVACCAVRVTLACVVWFMRVVLLVRGVCLVLLVGDFTAWLLNTCAGGRS
jgi:hypothetical protein